MARVSVEINSYMLFVCFSDFFMRKLFSIKYKAHTYLALVRILEYRSAIFISCLHDTLNFDFYLIDFALFLFVIYAVIAATKCSTSRLSPFRRIRDNIFAEYNCFLFCALSYYLRYVFSAYMHHVCSWVMVFEWPLPARISCTPYTLYLVCIGDEAVMYIFLGLFKINVKWPSEHRTRLSENSAKVFRKGKMRWKNIVKGRTSARAATFSLKLACYNCLK